MQNLLNQAPCLFFSSRDDGSLLEVNSYLCTLLHYQPDELLGKKVEMLFTIATRIFQQTHFFPLLKMHGHAEEIYITLQRKDGEPLPVLINAERRMVDGTAIILYVGILVQNRQRFEEELIAAKRQAQAALEENTALTEAKQQLKAQAEELNRQVFMVKKQNEELRQFNHVVTHEMQEPLRKLSFFSGMLLQENTNEHQDKLIQKVRKVSGEMHGVLNGLQQYIWLNDTTLRIDKIELPRLLWEVQRNLENDFPEIELSVDIESAAALDGDVEQLRILFNHLLSNAIQFRQDGNKVFVTVSCHHMQLNAFKNIEGRYSYVDYARIQVSDKGIGFSPEYKTQVFELFKRLHPVSGRGIGLSICKKIVENHQGNISIDSAIDAGTTVTIDLPFHKMLNEPLIAAQKLQNAPKEEKA